MYWRDVWIAEEELVDGVAYCGLVCTVCVHAHDGCKGCRSGGGARECGRRDCCVERSLDGCWQCEAFPCGMGFSDKAWKGLCSGFVRCIKDEGIGKLLSLVEPRMGEVVDYGYYRFRTEQEILAFLHGEDRLEDVLTYGLSVVFCGTASGPESARKHAYYANARNQFWDVLYRTGLTPHRLDCCEYAVLPEYGVGLTDLVKDRSGIDAEIRPSQAELDCFASKVVKYAPRALAFNGKRAARECYHRRRGGICYGRQPEPMGATVVFILPSTSGNARRWWSEPCWTELADFAKSRKLL